MNGRIFVVSYTKEHHLEQIRMALVDFGFEPVFISNKVAQGRTIIEQLESHTKTCSCALVIYTAAEWGMAHNKPVNTRRHRARQNVVFEHGYCLAKYGRDKVITLMMSGRIEMPSDTDGLLYIPFDQDWKARLGAELSAIKEMARE